MNLEEPPFNSTRNPETGAVQLLTVNGGDPKPPTPEEAEARKKYFRPMTDNETRALKKWMKTYGEEKSKAEKDEKRKSMEHKKKSVSDIKKKIAKDGKKKTAEFNEVRIVTKPYKVALHADEISNDLDYMHASAEWFFERDAEVERERRAFRKNKKKARAARPRAGRNPTQYNGGSSRVQARPSQK